MDEKTAMEETIQKLSDLVQVVNHLTQQVVVPVEHQGILRTVSNTLNRVIRALSVDAGISMPTSAPIISEDTLSITEVTIAVRDAIYAIEFLDHDLFQTKPKWPLLVDVAYSLLTEIESDLQKLEELLSSDDPVDALNVFHIRVDETTSLTVDVNMDNSRSITLSNASGSVYIPALKEDHINLIISALRTSSGNMDEQVWYFVSGDVSEETDLRTGTESWRVFHSLFEQATERMLTLQKRNPDTTYQLKQHRRK